MLLECFFYVFLGVIRCICQSAALVASHACSFLSRSPEEQLLNVYSYVSGSAKEIHNWNKCRRFLGKKQRTLKLVTTRWLSRYDGFIGVLENWVTLEHYFLHLIFLMVYFKV